jgi:hypothetical protein
MSDAEVYGFLQTGVLSAVLETRKRTASEVLATDGLISNPLQLYVATFYQNAY